MGLFSIFKKNKSNKSALGSEAINSIFDAANESVNAYNMMEKEKQENGGQLKKNVVCQPEHITITSSRKVMTRGVPAEYYFPGDNTNSSGEFSFLKALKIDIANAVKNGIPGKNSWEGSKCFLVAENNEYGVYNYGCYPDASGGCTVIQKKANPSRVLFMGKAKMNNCIFHNYLMQIDNSAYGTELYLFAKDINTGDLKIYPWFGKYAIPTGRGSRYDQDTVKKMYVDENTDSIIIEVSRQSYINPSADDNEALCNADTDYIMTVKYDGKDFYATAEFPELNISVVYQNQY